ncbi:MAG TPA: pilus assembly protein, partial [Smithellaceae bacterium]|nr:pilus assembly protein [Smithellaceae bacterium]
MLKIGCCVSSRSRGASAVEFALIMPLFFLLLFGIVDFGWYFFNQHTIQYATREGARLALVGRTLQNPDGSNMSREASIIKTIK